MKSEGELGNPMIKVLQEKLAKERDDLRNLFVEFDGDRNGEFIEKYLTLWNDVYDIMEESRYHRAMINSMVAGHEAASARLLGLLEKAVEMAEFYAKPESIEPHLSEHPIPGRPGCTRPGISMGFYKIAREFLTTLADASGDK